MKHSSHGRLPLLLHSAALLAALSVCCAPPPPKMDPKMAVEIEPQFLGPRYEQNDVVIDRRSMIEELQKRPETARYVRASQTWALVGVATAAAGGVLIGWPLGTELSGGDPLWELAAIGGGLLVLTIPISVISENKLKRGVVTFNDSLGASSAASSAGGVDLSLAWTAGGLHLQGTF